MSKTIMKQTDKSLVPWDKKIDIRGKEEYRTYVFFEEGFKCEVTIEKPVFLIVTDNGHRIFDEERKSHYVPYGWKHIVWQNTEGRTDGFWSLEQENK